MQKYSKYFSGDAIDLGAGSSPFKNFILSKANTYTAVDWSNSLYDSNVNIQADLGQNIGNISEFTEPPDAPKSGRDFAECLRSKRCKGM